MASDKPPVNREAVEPSDQSIKARKFQLFEERKDSGTTSKRFTEYVLNTPPTPLAPGVKVALGAVAVVVVLLLLASLVMRPSKRRHATLAPDRPAIVAFSA
jgi:hypothetical protein